MLVMLCFGIKVLYGLLWFKIETWQLWLNIHIIYIYHRLSGYGVSALVLC